MARIRDRQEDEFRRRMRLPESNPGHISREAFTAFLSGEVFLADGSPLGGRVGTSRLIEAMIRAGGHKVTDGGKGMDARRYKYLWPEVVIQPSEYAGRFNILVAVDLTIAIPALVVCGNTHLWVQPEACEDIVTAPADATGKPLTRYIAFCQLGGTHLGHPVEQCRREFTERSDEVGLVSREGLHLPIQYEAHLRHYAVDLAGSRYDEGDAPCVGWFGVAGPGFSWDGVRDSNSGCGSASRGSQVVAVS